MIFFTSFFLYLFVTAQVVRAQDTECPDFSSCVCDGADCVAVSFVGKGFTNSTCDLYCSETCNGYVDSFTCGIPDDYPRDTCANGGFCTCGVNSDCLDASEVPLLGGGIYSEDECDLHCEERCGLEYDSTYSCTEASSPNGTSSADIVVPFWCQAFLVVATLFIVA